jgi:iron-sulfur cluster assembly accessory protein
MRHIWEVMKIIVEPSGAAAYAAVAAGRLDVRGLRVGVVGGGCSGFQYSMSFENGAGMMDKTFDFDGLKVYVDATSLMYLKGVSVDYIETLEAAGFRVNTSVKEGDARSQILEFAAAWRPDVIVVGSHGRKGAKRFLLGSVSEAVARHAHCSVQIVRSSASP